MGWGPMRHLTTRYVAVDDRPHDVVLAGSRRAFVACAASVVGIDLAHGSVTARFPSARGKKRLALVSDRYLVEACESLGSIRILDLLDAARTTAALQMPIAGLLATNTGIWFGSEDCLRELDFSGDLGRQIAVPGVMAPRTSDAEAAADDYSPYGLGPLATDRDSLAYCATRVAGADVLHVVNLDDGTVLGTGWDPWADGEGSADIVSIPPQPSAGRRITDVVLDPSRTYAYVSCAGWFVTRSAGQARPTHVRVAGREDSRAELCSPPLLAERAVVRLEESRKPRSQAQNARRCSLPNELMVDHRIPVGEDVPEGDDPRQVRDQRRGVSVNATQLVERLAGDLELPLYC